MSEKKCCWFTNKIGKISDKLWLSKRNDKSYDHTYPFNKNNKSIKFESNGIQNNKTRIEYKEPKNKLKQKQISLDKQIKNINSNDKLTKKDRKNKIYKARESYIKYLYTSQLVIKTTRVTLNLSVKQRDTIIGWMRVCDSVYNCCVNLFNSKNSSFNINYQLLKLTVFNKLFKKKHKPCPYDILTDEVRAFCSNLKSCLTNKQNQNIKRFQLKHKRNLDIKSILISKKVISKNGIYTSILGKLNTSELCDLPDIISDSRLIYDKKKNIFYLNIPIYTNKKDIIHPDNIVSIDPGESIPYVTHSTNNYCKIGENIKDRILNEQSKIRRFQKAMSNGVRNKKKLKNKLDNSHKKIHHIVKELHNKTAIFLCSNYKRILLPEFKTQDILKKLDVSKVKEIENPIIRSRINKLYKRVKFVLLSLSHYRFRQHLRF